MLLSCFFLFVPCSAQWKRLEEEEKFAAISDPLSQHQRSSTSAGGTRSPGAGAPNSNDATQQQQQQQSLVGDAKVASSYVGEVLDKNPVFESIARYLGIDLTSEGQAARNRRGVAMIVHGPPLSGKTRAATALAKHYECAMFTIDTVVSDAIASSTSPAAARVRQMCAEAAIRYAEEQRLFESLENSKMHAAAIAATLAGQTSGLHSSQTGLDQHSSTNRKH